MDKEIKELIEKRAQYGAPVMNQYASDIFTKPKTIDLGERGEYRVTKRGKMVVIEKEGKSITLPSPDRIATIESEMRKVARQAKENANKYRKAAHEVKRLNSELNDVREAANRPAWFRGES